MADLLRTHFEQHQQAMEATLARMADASQRACDAVIAAVVSGHKLFAMGNGGSATHASHLVGELIGRFSQNRTPLPAVALVSDPGSVTCIANDFGFATLFARQIEALAAPGDVIVGFTTSGRSENVARGFVAAKGKRAVTIALSGAAGLIGADADHVAAVPSQSTAIVQDILSC
jgi:D-sedoheptulose 7-phosphate isomerase